MKHDLKILTVYFDPVLNGSKTFEHRYNSDRGFQPEDVVILREWDKEGKDYTGRAVKAKVGYVLPVSETYVVFSLLNVEEVK